MMLFITTALAADTVSLPEATDMVRIFAGKELVAVLTFSEGGSEVTVKCGSPKGEPVCKAYRAGSDKGERLVVTGDGAQGFATFPSGFTYQKVEW